jgi:hypothetical protein
MNFKDNLNLGKPVRIIDIARLLKLSTATIIDFLGKNCYPVERSHHTPLTSEALSQIANEFCSKSDSIMISQLLNGAQIWENAHKETALQIKQQQQQGLERYALRRQRAEKVIAGRERMRILRQQFAEEREKASALYSTTSSPMAGGDGRITPDFLKLEIIQKALSLEEKGKINFLNFLKKLNDLY